MALMQQTSSPFHIFDALGKLRNKIAPLAGRDRRQTALSEFVRNGFMEHMNDAEGLRSLMLNAPGPWGAQIPDGADLDAFLNHLASGELLPQFDPIGTSGGRFAGQGERDDRPLTIWDRPNCDLYCIGSAALGGGDSTDTLAITELSGKYTDAVLLFDTAQGRIQRITSLKVDGRPFYFGEGGVMGASFLDVELDYHPGRQGLYVGDVDDKIELEVACSTPDAATWLVYLHAATARQAKVRQSGFMVPRPSRY